MITRTPYDRDNLKIGKKDKVLEVGPGHSPTFLFKRACGLICRL